MRQAYREVMDHIAVTEDMSARILTNLQNADLSPAKGRARTLPMRFLAAACFAVLLAGAIALPNFPALRPSESLPGVENGVLDRAQAASLEELSQLVGFVVEGMGELPFPVVETRYTAYNGALAEVTYLGENQSLTYRKLAGSADPSGDYTAYSHELVLELGAGTVTLKGEAGQYRLALWQDKAYSYSANTSQAYSEAEWTDMLEAG